MLLDDDDVVDEDRDGSVMSRACRSLLMLMIPAVVVVGSVASVAVDVGATGSKREPTSGRRGAVVGGIAACLDGMMLR